MSTHMPTASLLAAIALLGLDTQAQAQSKGLEVTVRDTNACPEEGAVKAALEARFGAERISMETTAGAALVLEVRGLGPGRVSLTFADGAAAPSVREVAFQPSECGELAQTISWIVDAWARETPLRSRALIASELEAQPGAGSELGSRPSSPLARSPKATRSARPTGETSRSSASRPSAAGSGLLPSPSANTGEPSPPSGESPAQTELTAGDEASEAIASRATRRPRTTLAVMAGAQAPVDTWELGFGAVAQVDLALHPHVAVGLQLGIDGAQGRAEPGEVTATLPSALVVARLGWVEEKWGPSLVAGVGAEAIVAQSRGYTESKGAVLFAPVFLVSGQWRQRVFSSLSVVAAVGTLFQPREESFSIDNVGTVLTLRRLRPFASLGVAWTF